MITNLISMAVMAEAENMEREIVVKENLTPIKVEEKHIEQVVEEKEEYGGRELLQDVKDDNVDYEKLINTKMPEAILAD